VPLRLSASQDIRAPAALVFNLISTPERLPEWNTSVASARRAAPDQPVGHGSRAIMSGRLLGQALESETEVVEFEPPRMFATRAVRGPRLHTLFRLDSTASGTRIGIEVSGEVPGGRLGAIVAEGFLRSELTASLDRLRALAEREAQAAAQAEPLEGGDPACWLHLDESRGN
jgi:uncharacterized protein YndB with AHSA1/START domain